MCLWLCVLITGRLWSLTRVLQVGWSVGDRLIPTHAECSVHLQQLCQCGLTMPGHWQTLYLFRLVPQCTKGVHGISSVVPLALVDPHVLSEYKIYYFKSSSNTTIIMLHIFIKVRAHRECLRVWEMPVVVNRDKHPRYRQMRHVLTYLHAQQLIEQLQ